MFTATTCLLRQSVSKKETICSTLVVLIKEVSTPWWFEIICLPWWFEFYPWETNLKQLFYPGGSKQKYVFYPGGSNSSTTLVDTLRSTTFTATTCLLRQSVSKKETI